MKKIMKAFGIKKKFITKCGPCIGIINIIECHNEKFTLFILKSNHFSENFQNKSNFLLSGRKYI